MVRRATTDLNCFCFAALISTVSCVYAQGASISLSWDPSPTPNLTGYVVHYGLASRQYPHHRLVSTNGCRATIGNLVENETYFFAVTARGPTGLDSLPSNEVSGSPSTPSSTSPLTVLTQGNGVVTPALNGQELLVGHTYKLTAQPEAGSIFVSWTGGVTSSAPALSFVMVSNLVLKATFMTNPFPAIAGSYNGLFCETAGVRAGHSGLIIVSATGQGAFSGKVTLAGHTHRFSGRLEVNGKATNVIARPHTNALTVELDFNEGGPRDRVTGRVTGGSWSAPLLGERATFDPKTNPAPYAGSYTLVVPGADDADNGPEGAGYAMVTVDSGGGVKFVGALADGSKVSQKASLSHAGIWPLYLPLYHGMGAVLGWQTISNAPNADIAGLLSWIRLGQPGSKYWPAGFTNEITATGSSYAAPGLTNQVLQLTQYDLTFIGGNLAAPVTNAITLDAHNKIVVQDANELSLTITLKSGLFSGKVLDPVTGQRLSFRGAVLQKQDGGAGFLLGTNRSARVVFGF